MRHFSFAQPFLFSSSLLSIILEYAQRPKEDIPEATVHIFQGKAHVRHKLYRLPDRGSKLASPDHRRDRYAQRPNRALIQILIQSLSEILIEFSLFS